MVVCFIVNIRNSSSSTFYIVQSGDLLYTPKIGGTAVGSQRFEIPPGFEAGCEGLVVPWAATSRCGLEIGVLGEDDGQKVHTVVGPSDIDDGQVDWLRVHTSSWKAVASEHWLPLGKRHLLGAIGGTVELHLSFRDKVDVSLAPGEVAPSPEPVEDAALKGARQVAERIHFDREASCSPANTVFLNVYDLASAASIPNAMLCNSLMKTFGAFHAAVEVYGEEWGFYRQPNPEDCGICRSRRPRQHPVHVYRQSVNLGTTPLQDWEVWKVIREKVIPIWPSARYDLIHCNCIHFAEAFAQHLQVKPVPAWVKGLHEAGAALTKIPWPFNLFAGNSQEALPAPAPPPPASAGASASSSSSRRPMPGSEGVSINAAATKAQAINAAAAKKEKEAAASESSSMVKRPGFLPEPLPEERRTPPPKRGSSGSVGGRRESDASPQSARSQDQEEGFASAGEAEGEAFLTPVTK